MLTALGAAIMYISNLLPTGRLAAIAIAGLFSAAAVVHCGTAHGFGVFAATALLSAIIVPDKGNVLMYAAFLGYYPVLKSVIERMKGIPAVWAAKLALFNVVFAILWLTAREILMADFSGMDYAWIVIQLAANIVFVLYDRGLSGLIWYYITKVSTKIK